MKKKHWYIIGGVALLAIGGTILFASKAKAGNLPGDAGLDDEPVGEAPVDDPVQHYVEPNPFPLMQGSKGELVRKLQVYLNNAGSYGLAVDGIFGPMTSNAVVEETGKNYIPESYYDMFIKPEFGK